MEKRHFTIILEPEEDGGWHTYCPALKGCHTQGETIDEALRNVKEAITLYLKSFLEHGELAPEENIVIEPIEVVL